MEATEQVQKIVNARAAILEEVSKVIIGQEEVVDGLLTAIFSKGHVILEGVPGLAKTLMINSLSKALDLNFHRIQFTPDLMPGDITGTEILQDNKVTGEREFTFVKGPVFAHIVLADEINRTPPKTQAALLQAMQEYSVTTGGKDYEIEQPFFVLATQNPIEQEGTYPLPEAQLDRFMFKLRIDYPDFEDEVEIVKATTGLSNVEIEKVLSVKDIIEIQDLVRQVPVSDHIARYAVSLVAATRPGTERALDFVNDWVSWGAGPRAAQCLLLGGKARALISGRYAVSAEDIRAVACPVLRHRLVTNFNAEAENKTTDDIVKLVIENLKDGSK